MKHVRLFYILLLALVGALFANSALAEPASQPARERLLMDFGWKFHLGNEWSIGENLAKSGTGFGPAGVDYSDASWHRVDLPHDWAVELPFDRAADVSHGFKALGEKFPQNSVSWYRRSFTLPATDAGRRIWLEFDGVYRDARVFVNGWDVAHQESGYSGFRVDVTDVVNCGGTNVISVRVDATQTEGWFYEGAGIYRHVWLVKTAPLAIEPDGVFVYSAFPNDIPEGAAQIHVQTTVRNTLDAAAEAKVRWEVVNPKGVIVAKADRLVQVASVASAEASDILKVDTPLLWSPETPYLYRLRTYVSTADGQSLDAVETNFGIRTFAFDADRGFLLNGKPYLIKGTCNHQDHAGVGSALPDRLQEFRLEKLKEMGVNAYRTAHHAPTPELLDACDRLGILVMDENRLLGSDPLHLKWFEEQIRRDRNHASVAIWSLANEEFTTQSTPAGGRVATTMQALAKRLDPTRPVTYNAPLGNDFDGINGVIEVRGWSYHIGAEYMDAYHAAHPKQPNVGSEQGSTVGTRGIYANDPQRGYVSAYDDNAQSWSNTAEQWLSFFDTRPWLSGGFVWTGFDYRGEPTPYAWPCINSHFGIYDTCGFPKDNFWYYQSWWTNQPVLHLLPHWNWAGREGQAIDVRAFSNCDEVELFLNGASLGRQTMKHASHLRWSVPYAPGTLSAKGFKAGKLIAETKVETTGAPASVQLTPDRKTIDADARDISVVTVAIADAQGRVVPTAGNLIHFELKGPGRIIGVGNGDPSCHEPDVFVPEIPIQTVSVGGWRWKTVKDPYAANLPETAVVFDDSSWTKFDIGAESGPLGVMGRGVFRTTFNVTAEQLAAPVVELWFGKIEGDGLVFLNGEKIGPSGYAGAPVIFDVKRRLHLGENTIAVTLANYGDAGGLNKGVALRLVRDPIPPKWSRSTFNGLAQIIVQSSRDAGPITLTARGDGLQPSTITIESTHSESKLSNDSGWKVFGD